jgi:uncharacterized membrane protein
VVRILPATAILALGIAIVAGHNLLDPLSARTLGTWWLFIHERGPLFWNGNVVAIVAYPLLAWFGIMALGYGLGWVFVSPHRDRSIVTLALGMLTLFAVLRWLNVYGDPQRWMPQATTGQWAMSFFNVQKYPPSLLYICITLAPMLMLVPVFDRVRGPVTGFFRTFGSVPLMAYVAHLYVLHLVALSAHAAAGHNVDGMFNSIHDIFLTPHVFAGTSFPLWTVYMAWITVLATIYPLCRWWSAVKRRRRDWWLSYL